MTVKLFFKYLKKISYRLIKIEIIRLNFDTKNSH